MRDAVKTVITITIDEDAEDSLQMFEDFGAFMGKNVGKSGIHMDIRRE